MQARRVLFSAFLPLCISALGQQRLPSYGPDFLWGAAISAHQVEGILGGGQNSDWYVFEHTPGNILNGDNADVATNHWERYSEDFGYATAMGLKTVRTSVAWEKIEPTENGFNSAVIQHYRTELQTMRSMGLRPMVTLLHGTTPLWFAQNGGWLAPGSADQFARYAAFVVSQLGDLCDLWVTLNEPMVLVTEGYLLGTAPPQIKSPGAAILAAFNLVRAHRLATARIHEVQPVKTPNTPGTPLRGVGLVSSLDVYDPHSPLNPLDVITTGLVREFGNWAFPRAAVSGNFDMAQFLSALNGSHESAPSRVQDPPSAGSPVLDWLGVNYYTRTLVSFSSDGLPKLTPPPGPAGDNRQAIFPAGTERILRETAARFPGIPIVVTENGVADAQDRYRPQFIHDTLHYLDLARFGHDGLPPLDIRGYYHWSLTDNFEWQSGYSIRFGLIAIDYANGLKRTPRASAAVYATEVQARK